MEHAGPNYAAPEKYIIEATSKGYAYSWKEELSLKRCYLLNIFSLGLEKQQA